MLVLDDVSRAECTAGLQLLLQFAHQNEEGFSNHLRVAERQSTQRFAISKLDEPKFRKSVVAALQLTNPPDPRNEDSLDAAAIAIKQAISIALENHCPAARLCPLTRRAWSPECSALLKQHRRTSRKYTHPQARRTANDTSSCAVNSGGSFSETQQWLGGPS
jgi:hypothetical protein